MAVVSQGRFHCIEPWLSSCLRLQVNLADEVESGSVAVPVIPARVFPVGTEIQTVLIAVVVVWLAATPVGIRERFPGPDPDPFAFYRHVCSSRPAEITQP